MATTDNALEVEGLTVRLGATEVIRDLSFTVPRASSLAVIGPNGAGKTVLLRALIGALPYAGTIRWAPGTRIGYLPQKLDIERDLPVSGRDLLRAKAALSKATDRDVQRALADVGLDDALLAQPIGTLAGGQFQRLLIAFALLGQPSVLLLDEPAAGVDAPGQTQLDELVRRLESSAGITVVLVSHDLSVVYRYADHVLCLGRGHACFGPPHVALTPETLHEIYGTPVAFHRHDEHAH
jgi:zinc transport system ATP-binding protein